MGNAVNMGLYCILKHLDNTETYARIMFVDCSSMFNTIIAELLQDKLSQLNVSSSICQWITDFLTKRTQHVNLGKHFSALERNKDACSHLYTTHSTPMTAPPTTYLKSNQSLFVTCVKYNRCR